MYIYIYIYIYINKTKIKRLLGLIIINVKCNIDSCADSPLFVIFILPPLYFYLFYCLHNLIVNYDVYFNYANSHCCIMLDIIKLHKN